MTVKEAKFALIVGPPDDETNPDVPGLAEAIEIAKRNPQMHAWWEREKHFDRTFSRKLGSINPPPELAATIMRGGATIFFASRLIAESMGENPDDDSTLPENIAAEPILPKGVQTEEFVKAARKEPGNPNIWIWRWAGLAFILLLIGSCLLFAAFYL